MTDFNEELNDNSEIKRDEDLEEISEDNPDQVEEEDIQEDIDNLDRIEEEAIQEDIDISSIEESDEVENEVISEDLELPEEDEVEGSETMDEESIEELEMPEMTEESIEKQMRDFQKNMIEAALYAAGKPLDVEILSTKLEIPKKIVSELINELAFDYLERSTALVIAQMGDSYQMQIKSEFTEKVSKFATGGAIAERYLRTLTIIALKQPILKSMVIKLRGSGAYEHVKYLLDNELIDAVKKGRSQELTTTEKYSQMFGLPTDREAMKQMMIAQLGLDDQGGVQGYEPEPEDQGESQDVGNDNETQE